MDIKKSPQNGHMEMMYRYAAELVRAGKTDAEIQKDLMSKGIKATDASVMVQKLRVMQAQAAKKDAMHSIQIGVLALLIGGTITAVTMSAAEGGGTYVVAYGAIIYGAYMFLKGLFLLFKK